MQLSKHEPNDEARPFSELRGLHVQQKRAYLRDHLERVEWSRERIDAERRLRLRELLRIACERSAFHRARLAGIRVDRLEERDLARLPPMTKADVMGHFDAIVTDPRLSRETVEAHLASLGEEPRYLPGGFQAIASGGSSGVRGVYVYDWDAWRTCYLGWIRYLVRDLGGRPFTMAAVTAGRAIHVSRALLQTFSDPEEIAVRSLPVTWPVDRIVEGLNQLQPDAFGGYPSALPALVLAAQDGRLKIRPRRVITGGEPLLPEIRAAAEETWGVPVANWWLCSEGGPMGLGCGVGAGMHLAEDLVIVEPVDAAGQPVPPGTRSAKLYLTNLYNTAMPLIRYELTDEVTLLDEPCPCGSAHRRVADVQGRLDDGFVYGSVTVHPHLFRSVLGSERAIVEYQVSQTARGAAVAVRGGPVDASRLERRLEAELERLGVPRAEVSIRVVERLERQDIGKLKRFLPLAN